MPRRPGKGKGQGQGQGQGRRGLVLQAPGQRHGHGRGPLLAKIGQEGGGLRELVGEERAAAESGHARGMGGARENGEGSAGEGGSSEEEEEEQQQPEQQQEGRGAEAGTTEGQAAAAEASSGDDQGFLSFSEEGSPREPAATLGGGSGSEEEDEEGSKQAQGEASGQGGEEEGEESEGEREGAGEPDQGGSMKGHVQRLSTSVGEGDKAGSLSSGAEEEEGEEEEGEEKESEEEESEGESEEGEGEEEGEGAEGEEVDFFQVLEKQVQWRPSVVLHSRGAKGRPPAPLPSHPSGPRIQAKRGKAGVPELRVLPVTPTPPHNSANANATDLGLLQPRQGQGQSGRGQAGRRGEQGRVAQGKEAPGGTKDALVQAAAAPVRGVTVGGRVSLEKHLLVPPVDTRLADRAARKSAPQTAGPKWFDLPAQTITPELKRDLRLLKLRGVMDPKRHYRAPDSTKFPKHFQIGTVVEGAADFYSARLTKKERQQTIGQELLNDSQLKSYRKRKYLQIQKEKELAGKKHMRRRQDKAKPIWARATVKD